MLNSLLQMIEAQRSDQTVPCTTWSLRQNTSWEDTWRPLLCRPGDTFRLKTFIQRAVWHLAATCGRSCSHLCCRRKQLFPFRLYLNYCDENFMRWQRAANTSWNRGEEQMKDLWRMYNEVSCGRTIIPMPVSSVHMKWWKTWMPLQGGLLPLLWLNLKVNWKWFSPADTVELDLNRLLSIQEWPTEPFFHIPLQKITISVHLIPNFNLGNCSPSWKSNSINYQGSIQV